jgi:uncharacterized membrane protein
MATAWWAILVVSLSTFIGAAGQYYFKKASENIAFDLKKLIANTYIIKGIGVYAVGSIIWILVLPYGELSTLYPFIAINYIWVAWVSKKFFKEDMNFVKWLGIASIVAGVALTGFGA